MCRTEGTSKALFRLHKQCGYIVTQLWMHHTALYTNALNHHNSGRELLQTLLAKCYSRQCSMPNTESSLDTIIGLQHSIYSPGARQTPVQCEWAGVHRWRQQRYQHPTHYHHALHPEKTGAHQSCNQEAPRSCHELPQKASLWNKKQISQTVLCLLR